MDSALAFAVFVTSYLVGVGARRLYVGTRQRPPRHARPKGWTGPGERAPFPPVAEWPPETEVLAMLAHPGASALSPLNREVMRRRFRVAMAEAHGKRLV